MRILEIGNWAPPVCSWTMSLVGLRRELEARNWDCRVMNLNENRRVRNSEYIDVQNGWDYLCKVLRAVRDGCAVHTRVNAESVDLYILAFVAMVLARLWRRPALLTYGGGHEQTFFPAPRMSVRHQAFSLLFRLPNRVYCNSETVKNVILTTGITPERVVPIPHTSGYYAQFTPTSMPDEVEKFFSGTRVSSSAMSVFGRNMTWSLLRRQSAVSGFCIRRWVSCGWDPGSVRCRR